MPPTIIAFGEIFWDTSQPDGRAGGTPFELARRLQDLGEQCALVSRIGSDPDGKRTLAQLRHLGLAVSTIQVDRDHPTGAMRRTADERGEARPVFPSAQAYDFVETTPVLVELAAAARCLCYDLLGQRSEPSRQTLRSLLDAAGSALKFLDLNLYPDRSFTETIQDALEAADIVKLSLGEVHYLAELFEWSDPSLPDFCAEMIEKWALDTCLVTLGAYGAFGMSKKHSGCYIPGFQVPERNHRGAGEAFAAAFLHSLLRHRPFEEALVTGNVMGALSVMQADPLVPLTRERALVLLREAPPPRVEPQLESYRLSE